MSAQKSILYICICHNTKVLTDFQKRGSSYHEVTHHIIPNIKKGTNIFSYEGAQFMTLSEGNRGLNYIILFQEGYSQLVGEECLKMIKDRFEESFPQEEVIQAQSFGLNKNKGFQDFLRETMVNLNFQNFRKSTPAKESTRQIQSSRA